MRFALTRGEVLRLGQERRAREAGEGQPINIRLLLDRLANRQVVPLTARRAPSDTIGFTYHFTGELVLWAARGRPYLILVWGLRSRGLFPDLVRRLLLLRARQVFVNDPTSALEVKALSGREPTLIPFVVDPEFFSFAPIRERGEFLFCPSNIDRDPEILCKLASAGHRVIWLNNDPDLADRYSGAFPNLEIVSRISFAELRRLYKTCRAVILPLSRDLHAAGQTTALEAIASGAPVLISPGRTSEIFAPGRLVTVVHGRNLRDWLTALEQPTSDAERARRRQCIESKHSPEVVGRMILALVGSW